METCCYDRMTRTELAEARYQAWQAGDTAAENAIELAFQRREAQERDSLGCPGCKFVRAGCPL